MCYALLLLLKPLYFNFNCMQQQHKVPFHLFSSYLPFPVLFIYILLLFFVRPECL